MEKLRKITKSIGSDWRRDIRLIGLPRVKWAFGRLALRAFDLDRQPADQPPDFPGVTASLGEKEALQLARFFLR